MPRRAPLALTSPLTAAVWLSLCAALGAGAACRSQPAARQAPGPVPVGPPVSLADLREGQRAHGFTATAQYLDAADQPIGARFVHDETGFEFDYLRIESAPQAFVWVNSLPTSDMGEPHTQEHLLLGKGDRGRRRGSVEAMALGESSAFTAQWRTAYHFHTVAGPEAYWTLLHNELDALLNPDYSDEEIRREVAHYGVTAEPGGALRLEEKGTVHNEMVRSYEQPGRTAWRVATQLAHGERHPLALESGGLPADIRRMTPEDIRTFHRRNYHLGNMGLIGAFPAAMELGGVLARTDRILDQLAGRTGPDTSVAVAPPASPAPAGTVRITEYPYHDDTSPGSIMLAWPATRELDLAEALLLELFVSSVAGEEGTNLYQLLVDSKTRALETGATGVWGWVSSDPGRPLFIGLSRVAAGQLDEAGAKRVRAAALTELRRIAGLPAGDPDLIALGERVRSRLLETRRSLAKQLNTPPGFGTRGTGSSWMDLLLELERAAGFRRSLVMKPQLDAVEAVLDAGGNPWSERLAAWGLLAEPYAVVARPSPAERARLDRERDERLAAETARIAKAHGTDDTAEALRRFAAVYEETTRALEASARAAAMPELVDSLPRTFDDGIDARQHAIGGVPTVTSTFPSTTAGTVGVALRLDGVPPALQPYLGILPELLSESGLVVDGAPLSAEQVAERQRREILGLRSWISTDARSGRVELVVEGQGLDPEETRRAIDWMVRVLTGPDWRPDNLPRLRDLVDREAKGLRAVMQGAEERWVNNPGVAYRRQRSGPFVHAASFLTAAHDAHRLGWMLRDPGAAASREAAARAIEALAPAGRALPRARLAALSAALGAPAARPPRGLARWLPGAKMPAEARALVRAAGADLSVLLPDLPDDSLAADWAYLCRQMAADLRRTAPATLEELARLRELVVRRAHARLYVIGSADTQAAIAADLDRLAGALGDGPALPPVADGARSIDERLRARQPDATAPVFVGLVNPSTQSGVFVHTAAAPDLLDTREDALLDFLASNLYTGHGAHSLFMKTWAAGLAYSNGVRVAVRQGILTYYAERCPELAQTLRFVVGELERARPAADLVKYALAEAFSSRIAASYEERGRALADDLADGVPPEAVRRFRDALLALRGEGDLAARLFERMNRVYARVLPGLGEGWTPADGAVYLVIGPHRQLDSWQSYLTAEVGSDARLFRLHPRDFWIPAALPGGPPGVRSR